MNTNMNSSHSLSKRVFNYRHLWLSFLAGSSLVFAYAPFSQWWLSLIVPCLFLHFIKNKTPAQARNIGFSFALGWFVSGISWVHVSIDQFGGMPLIVSLLLMLLLAMYLALFSALACYLTAYFSPQKRLNLWLFPSFWLFTEFLRSIILTGFPWLSLGYSQIDSPLATFAPVIGEVGITTIVLYINIALYHLIHTCYLSSKTSIDAPIDDRKSLVTPISVLSTIGLLTVIFSTIQWVHPTGEIKKVALIQGNIPQTMKWSPEQEWPTLVKYLDLTRVNYNADIIIWPESAIPAVEPAVQDYLGNVNRSALFNNSAVITGIINYNYETKDYFNSLIVLGKKQSDDKQGYYYNSSNRYYKHHLLPIGEFVPFQEWLRPLAPFFNLPMSSFTRGKYQQPNLIANNLHILPLICFEIAFPDQLAANLTNKTDMILTVSNDAWFADSHGPHQHLEIARMRALEFGKPLLRSTNNGITAVVNHYGKIIARIPQFQEAVLTTNVQLVNGQTPYSQWSTIILVLLISIPALITMMLLRLKNT